MVTGKLDDWYVKMHDLLPSIDENRSFESGEVNSSQRASLLPSGFPACCSPDTITFHYVEAKEQLALHDALHHREKWLALDDETRISQWPNQKEIGGYAHPLPRDRVSNPKPSPNSGLNPIPDPRPTFTRGPT